MCTSWITNNATTVIQSIDNFLNLGEFPTNEKLAQPAVIYDQIPKNVDFINLGEGKYVIDFTNYGTPTNAQTPLDVTNKLKPFFQTNSEFSIKKNIDSNKAIVFELPEYVGIMRFYPDENCVYPLILGGIGRVPNIQVNQTEKLVFINTDFSGTIR